MFAHVGIDEPIEKIFDDWDFLEERIVKKFTAWQEIGENIIGIRRREVTLTEVVDPKKGVFNSISLSPAGLISKEHHGLKIHVTPGGVPHRVQHGFGYWHINDMDELYLPIPPRAGETMGHFIAVMQNPTEHEGESFAQYCQRCFTMLFEYYHTSGKSGWRGLFQAEEAAVNAYNADPKLRHCPECGFDNFLSYCSNVVKDSPEQAAARKLW